MSTPTGFIEEVYERGETYTKTSFQLAKLKGLETSTIVITALVSKMSVVLMFVVCILLINVGLALWLGDLLGKTYYGFFIVGGFYLVLGTLFYLFLHKWIKKPISNIIITEVLQ